MNSIPPNQSKTQLDKEIPAPQAKNPQLRAMFSIWGICGLVALILWFVALFLPAYNTNTGVISGTICFLFGPFLLPLWAPNLFLFAFIFKHLLTNSTPLAKSHWGISARVFIIAITLTPIALALLALTLKDVPNGDVSGHVMSIGLGAYLWLSSIVIASLGTMIRALRRS